MPGGMWGLRPDPSAVASLPGAWGRCSPLSKAVGCMCPTCQAPTSPRSLSTRPSPRLRARPGVEGGGAAGGRAGGRGVPPPGGPRIGDSRGSGGRRHDGHSRSISVPDRAPTASAATRTRARAPPTHPPPSGNPAARQITLGGKPVSVGGMCKGSGMIHPNMATMLGVVTTDAAVAPEVWRGILRRATDASFNSVGPPGASVRGQPAFVCEQSVAWPGVCVSCVCVGGAKSRCFDGTHPPNCTCTVARTRTPDARALDLSTALPP